MPTMTLSTTRPSRKGVNGYKRIEDLFAGLEGETSRLIKNAITDEILPTPRSSDHDLLLTFVIAQAFRTRQVANETNALADQQAKRMLANVPLFKEHMDKIEITINNAPLYSLRIAAMHIDLTRDLRYKLLCNRTVFPFIISDDPAVLYNQFLDHRKKTGSNTGLAVKGLQLFLPLGPKHLIMFFDADVYTVGGRRLSSLKVEVTDKSDVRELNILQAANAGESLYFNDGYTQQEIETIARKSVKYRNKALAQILEYPPSSGDTAKDGVLLRMFNPDVRTHLRLHCVKLTPQAERYELGERVIHHRDPELCKLHKRFLEAVKVGNYQIGQFQKYLDDIVKGNLLVTSNE